MANHTLLTRRAVKKFPSGRNLIPKCPATRHPHPTSEHPPLPRSVPDGSKSLFFYQLHASGDRSFDCQHDLDWVFPPFLALPLGGIREKTRTHS